MHTFLSSARRGAFTLVELIISIAMLGSLMVFLFAGTEAASRAWRDGQARTDAFQSGRTTLEMVAREVAPAVVDTRMQMVVLPGERLQTLAADIAPEAPALFWMAPLGENGDLRCVGYYLTREARLKRLYIAPFTETGAPSPYFPRLASAKDPSQPTRLINPRNDLLRPSPVDAEWFTRDWDTGAFDDVHRSDTAVVSTVADGVVAWWVQGVDLQGQPIPWVSKSQAHPASRLIYNSAAYFQMATSPSARGEASFLYLAPGPQAMRANRLPAALEFTLLTLDAPTLAKAPLLPAQPSVVQGGYLDVEASVVQYRAALAALGIHQARTFTSRAPLINGN